jgi:hypothetical protein
MQLTKEEKIKLKEINCALLELINYFNCYIDLETI